MVEIDPLDETACRNCKFWEHDDYLKGDCRRRSPIIVEGMIRPELEDARRGEAIWPQTYADEWCGEFELA